MFTSKKMKHFIAVAQQKSIKRASETLFITASPLSKSIAAIEDKLGCPLFERRDQSLELTEFGQILYQKLLPIYEKINNIEKDVSKPLGKKSYTICIDKDYPEFVLSNFSSILEKIPTIKVIYEQIVSHDFIFQGDKSKYGAIITFKNIRNDDIIRHDLPCFEMVFAVARKYENIPLVQLINEVPWIQSTTAHNPGLRNNILPQLMKYTSRPTVIYRDYDIATRMKLVSEGSFISLVPWSAMKMFSPDNIRYIKCDEGKFILNDYFHYKSDEANEWKKVISFMSENIVSSHQ
jgi:DNA-binding transcriptional LysR family regulator